MKNVLDYKMSIYIIIGIILAIIVIIGVIMALQKPTQINSLSAINRTLGNAPVESKYLE
jgi:hypothetical protein